jgi:hypothetical protein
MALTRRQFIWAAPLCAFAVAGCTSLSQSGSSRHLQQLVSSRTGAKGARTILVFMPDTAQTRQVWSGLRDELGDDYQLIAVRLEAASDSPIIEEALRLYQPSGLVLMNNPTVNAYRHFQRKHPGIKFPPAIIVMTSFLETSVKDIRGATGISYEIPLITAMTNLRRLLALKQERVGVISRAPLRGFIQRQVELCAREKVAVIQEEVSQSPNASELKRAIRRLKQRADVIWILNDDKLLTRNLISEAWVVGLDERPWLPTIVGAASLVSARSNLGTFAVLPDHVALGAQAASMLLDLAENDWQMTEEDSIQLPLSTTTTIDLVQTRERFALQKDALQRVDRILE